MACALALALAPRVDDEGWSPATRRPTVAARAKASAQSSTVSGPEGEAPAGLSRDGWGQIQRALRESEYDTASIVKAGNGASLVAPNRAQGYRTTFRSEGIEIVPGPRAGAAWRLGVSLTGYGRPGDVRPLPRGEPRAAKERVEYRRGPVTEWYVNGPAGLEQGFTIAESQASGTGPMVLALAVEGGLEPRVEDADVACFRDGAGRTRVRYVDLAAWDADGRALASRLEASEGELRVLVEAGEARFPVTVDPIFVQEARIEGHGDALGVAGAHAAYSVSVSGNTAVVGAPADDTAGGVDAGSAYVFVRSGTTWSQQQKLMASDGAGGDGFGTSVSISGNTVVVGAPGDDNADGVDAGSAYVFVRSGTTWSEQQKLVDLGGPAGVAFGMSVSVSGNTTLIGAPLTDTPDGVDAGVAYVFVRSGTVWSAQDRLRAPFWGLPSAGDFFGFSVSVSGDTAVIGAQLHTTAGGMGAGSAYVFVRSGTAWSEQQKLVAPDGATGDSFGESVSVSGDTVVVGATGDDSSKGSAYVFVRSGTAWSPQHKLVAPDGAASDYFGLSVSVSVDTTVIGAPFADTVSGVDAGSAYAFVRSGTAWSEQQELIASEATTNDDFGRSISVSGDTAVVGAYLDDTASGVDAGSAYVFVRSGTVWSEQQKLMASDAAAGDQFGVSVSVSGDTAVVGAYVHDTAAGVDAGSAYVFVRSGTVWSEQQKLEASDAAAYDGFGKSVAVSGDTVVVGAYGDDTAGGVDAGSAYVFVRTGTVWTEQAKLVASDGALGESFGVAVAVSGDTAVVGAYLDNTTGGVGAGSAYVFVRSGTAWSQQGKLVALDGHAGDNLGISVSASGDTVVAGAYLADTAGVDAGSAYVFVRSGTAWSEQGKLVALDGAANDGFGISVAVVGDTALVGAYASDTAGGANAGSAYVFVRTGTLWREYQKLVASDGAAGAFFGTSVSLSGDTALVGAFLDDTASGVDAGSAYVFRAPAADLSLTKTDGQATAVPGQPVSYTIVVANAGPASASAATVTDTLPAALTGATWTCVGSPGADCTASGNGSIVDTVALPAAGTVTYTLTATIDPSATGSLTNTASVEWSNDPAAANDTALDNDTLMPQADLALAQSDSQDPVHPGSSLTYTVQVTNLGPSASTGMALVDVLPPQVTFVSVTPGAPTCIHAGPAVTCNLGALLPAATHSLAIQVTVDAGALGTINNTASVTGAETDPVSSNDSVTEPTLVVLRATSELVHGTRRVANLAPVPGLPDGDLFLIGQKPYSSYEVVVDATSGDIGTGQGPELSRLASDGTTVLQSSVAAGAGPSRSLRFENATALAVNDQYVRVRSAGCTTSCGAEDVYRIRAWDTTLLVPRFNNSGTQITILVLQNSTAATVSGHARFWNTAGALVGTRAFALGPKAAYVVNTSTIPGVAGVGGTITLSHDGPYGGLTGKAVAVEPATGFAFDTALEPRRR